MQDDNTQNFMLDNSGKVIGIDLAVIPIPGSTYECVGVRLVPETEAQGQNIATIMVLDEDNTPKSAPVYLGWPFDGTTRLTNRSLPGNQNYPAQHVISNSFDPKSMRGPLAVYVGGADGNIVSDVVGGLGLPYGHHISFHVTFRERAAGVVTPAVMPDVPGLSAGASIEVQVAHIVKQIDLIAAKVL